MLFTTLFQRMNLSYLDRMPDMPGFQATVAYSLYVLSKTDRGWKRTDELTREVLLPEVRREMENTGLEVHWFLSNRFFGSLEDFGLLEQRELPENQQRIGVDEVRKTELFDRFVRFYPTQ